MFPNASLNLIYTVFPPSHHAIVRAILALHVCQFVGLALFPNATCTHHTKLSVPHVVFNVTLVEFVYVALLFTTKLHHVGAVISICIVAADANVA